jgi:hypothetical protein
LSKLTLFTLLLAGICTRALHIGYVFSLRQVPWWDKFLRQNPILPFLPKPTPTLFVILALNELQKQTESGNFISGRRDLPGQMMEAHKANPEIFREGDVFAIAFRRCKYLSVPKTGVATGGTCSGADSDSTTSAMQSLCHLVLSSEPVHKKLLAEIVDAEKSGLLSEIITCIQLGGGSHLCIGRNLGLVEMNNTATAAPAIRPPIRPSWTAAQTQYDLLCGAERAGSICTKAGNDLTPSPYQCRVGIIW